MAPFFPSLPTPRVNDLPQRLYSACQNRSKFSLPHHSCHLLLFKTLLAYCCSFLSALNSFFDLFVILSSTRSKAGRRRRALVVQRARRRQEPWFNPSSNQKTINSSSSGISIRAAWFVARSAVSSMTGLTHSDRSKSANTAYITTSSPFNAAGNSS